MKRFFLIILFSLLLPVAANAYDAYINGIFYNFSGNEAEVTSLDPEGNANAYSGAVRIPQSVTYEDTTYSVTSIGDYAFWGCSKLTTVTIPKTVTRIGDFAFNSCSGLTSISIPKGVTRIGKSAFTLCTGLTNITIPNGVTSIEDNTFAGCSALPSVTIPDGVTTIGKMAFCNCSRMASIIIPKSVTSIGEKAFSSCVGLISIKVETGNMTYDSRDKCNAIIETATNTLIAGCDRTVIPKSVTSIGSAAFWGCSSSTPVSSLNSLARHYYNHQGLTYLHGLESITIPEGVTTIGDGAFYWCYNLKDITIPKSVTSIGDEAFRGCFGLESINIPSNVNNIGFQAFSDCNLNFIKVDTGNITYDSRNNCNAIVETATNALIVGCKNTIIPNNISSISNFAFSLCKGLKSITIPDNVTDIGSSAFIYCSDLKEINCYAPNPPNVTDGAFGDGDKDIRSSITLHVPATSIEVYKTTEPWNGFKKIIPIESDFVQEDNVSPAPETEPEKQFLSESDSIYEIVDEVALFSGGEAEGYKWLSGQIQYPADCLEQGIQGRVLVSLVIGKDGSIEEAKAIRSPHPALSEEAERVVKSMPKWEPAKIEGKIVRSRFVMPIMFKLKPVESDIPENSGTNDEPPSHNE